MLAWVAAAEGPPRATADERGTLPAVARRGETQAVWGPSLDGETPAGPGIYC